MGLERIALDRSTLEMNRIRKLESWGGWCARTNRVSAHLVHQIIRSVCGCVRSFFSIRGQSHFVRLCLIHLFETLTLKKPRHELPPPPACWAQSHHRRRRRRTLSNRLGNTDKCKERETGASRSIPLFSKRNFIRVTMEWKSTLSSSTIQQTVLFVQRGAAEFRKDTHTHRRLHRAISLVNGRCLCVLEVARA